MVPDHVVSPRTYSLPEVHDSVSTTDGKRWRRILAFAGPAYLISVGYMDPGNWATDLEAGSRFGYGLLWVLVMSNFMAILLQTLSARLGIVSGRDLAQACRDAYPRSVSFVLWIFCEVAIIACDLAEVLGAAIGLNLLFRIPVLAGVLLTALDTLLVLWFTRLGIRMVEAFVLALIAIMAICFGFEIFFARPQVHEVVSGLVPHLNGASLYVAIAIIGATVMPHNLYLHSALVQTRRIGQTANDKRRACKWNFVDSAIALNGALFVNAAILILAASVFFHRHIVVREIQQAHQLLSPLLGTTAASLFFGLALLCSGQSSTLTGTMAGQIVMEGFVQFKIQPWLRRLVTRCLAILPAALTIYLAGDAGSYRLLLLSQVILSLQLPFAIIPLIQFTNDRTRMGSFANGVAVRWAASICALTILGLDFWLVWTQLGDAMESSGVYRPLYLALAVIAAALLVALLVGMLCAPLFRHSAVRAQRVAVSLPAESAPLFPAPALSTILLTLDHSTADQQAVGNALALARSNNARIVLLHVEEGVTSQVFGAQASTAEITEGQEYLDTIANAIRVQHVDVDVVIRHGRSPAQEIVALALQIHPDLIVMAAHGHRGIKDLLFGTTINSVRHKVKTPLLIV